MRLVSDIIVTEFHRISKLDEGHCFKDYDVVSLWFNPNWQGTFTPLVILGLDFVT